MTAALVANSTIFSMRPNPAATKRLFIERIRIQFTTLVAFTVPLTAGRRLAVTRSTVATANPSSGTAITTLSHKYIGSVPSICSLAGSGDIPISATAALSTASITVDTANPSRRCRWPTLARQVLFTIVYSSSRLPKTRPSRSSLGRFYRRFRRLVRSEPLGRGNDGDAWHRVTGGSMQRESLDSGQSQQTVLSRFGCMQRFGRVWFHRDQTTRGDRKCGLDP